ncbi:hypothetical protein EPO34_02405 [Patescibacteria group bacterium]|nr:MAG: hypothetical protein EPO34_02405 [Patescibacteria group bacterium]
MKYPWLVMLSFAAVGAIVLGFYAIRLEPIRKQAPSSTPVTTPLTTPTITFVDPSRGPTSAKVTIVEFADFQCEPCAATAKALAELMAVRTDIRVVWKNLPSESHALALPAAVASLCADRQGKFWEYHDALFAERASLSFERLRDIAFDLKLDQAAFASCLDAQETLPLVRRNVEEAQALGLTASPTLFIGSERVVGAVTLEELERYVDETR